MRMWEIRENPDYKEHSNYRSGYRMNYRDKSEKEIYECGYEDGWRDAMEELDEHRSGERRYNYRMR